MYAWFTSGINLSSVNGKNRGAMCNVNKRYNPLRCSYTKRMQLAIAKKKKKITTHDKKKCITFLKCHRPTHFSELRMLQPCSHTYTYVYATNSVLFIFVLAVRWAGVKGKCNYDRTWETGKKYMSTFQIGVVWAAVRERIYFIRRDDFRNYYISIEIMKLFPASLYSKFCRRGVIFLCMVRYFFYLYTESKLNIKKNKNRKSFKVI